MLTVSALFVDAAKVKLARGVMESAGDLALNTALTDYDTTLKDLYGLFGTAQNTEDLYAKLEDYYTSCIVSAGVTSDDAKSYASMIMSQLGVVGKSGNISDILNIQLMDFNAEKLDYATLANATIMKKQVVEFMKYRGPINTGMSFLSALQSFSTLSKQTELVEKRQEYYEEQQTVMEYLQSAWDEINEYDKLDLITQENYFADMKANMAKDYQNDYRGFNKKTIKDLYDTNGYDSFQLLVDPNGTQNATMPSGMKTYVENIWRYTYDGTAAHTYLDSQYLNAYSKDKLPTENDLKSLISGYYSAAYNMDVTYPSLKSYMNSAPSGAYDLQYLVQAARSHELRTTSSNGLNLYIAYQKLAAAMLWLNESEEAAELQNTSVSVQDASKKSVSRSIQDHYNSISSDFDSRMRVLKGIGDTFRPISDNVVSKSRTNPGSVGNSVNIIGTTVGGYRDTMDSAAEHLENAKTFLQKAYDSVNGGDLAQARDNWSKLANDSDLKDTSMGKQDKAEIEETRKYLNSEDLQKFMSRITNVAQNLRKSADQIEGYKFDNVFIGDIKNYKSLESAIESYVTSSALHSVPLDEGQLDSFCESHFKWDSGNLNVDWVNQPGTQVKLHGGGTDKLNFYSYLYTHFNKGDPTSHGTTKKEETPSEGKDKYEELKKTASDKAGENAKNEGSGIAAGGEIKDLAGLPTKENQGSGGSKTGGNPGPEKMETGNDAAKNTSKGLGDMFSGVGDALKSAGSDLYEKLLFSDYVMSMFSYDTIEKEWAKTKGEDSKPETLTREPIDKDHNYAYGREVEYVIYGGGNSGNVTKAYASIYAIRLGFNLIYAFTDSEIRETAFAIATPISAATLGVVPVPLIQAAIIVGIACVESGLDLAMLKDGEKVALFKNKDNWRTSPSGLVKGGADLVKKTADDALKFTEKKIGELMDMTDEELSKAIQSGTTEVENKLGSAYDTLIERQANTAIQQLTSFATQAVDEAALRGTNAIETVKSDLQKWANEGGESDLASKAKKAAVDYIINNGYVDNVVQQIQNAADGQISGIEDALKNELNGIRAHMLQSISGAGSEIEKYKDQLMDEARESLKKGSSEFRKTVGNQLDGIFGNESGAGLEGGNSDSGMASILSFSYSDYLRLFVMLGLYTNQAGIILRTADAVQANMIKNTHNEGFRLTNSAAYVHVNATVQVPPTLLALPLFANVEGNPSGNAGWYTLDFDGIQGY